MTDIISADLIGTLNDRARPALEDEYAALGRKLSRAGLDIEALTARAMAWTVAIPTWGVGTGGTRFARFPAASSPTS